MAVTYGMNVASWPLIPEGSGLVFGDLWYGTASRYWSNYSGTYRPDGYPTAVTGSPVPSNLMAINSHLPAGTYTLQVDGTGEVWLNGGWDEPGFWHAFTCSGGTTTGTLTYSAPHQPGQIDVVINQSSAADPIRNLRFWLPGHVGQRFYQGQLDNLAPWTTLRFMDWQMINATAVVNWADRLVPDGFSIHCKSQIPFEDIAGLCNATGKDCWVCIPATASDDFVTNMAAALDTLLTPGLTIYIEFSNEVWNNFQQYGQMQAMQAADTDPDKEPGTWEWIARRDGHCTNLFKASLPTSRPCKVVLARQMAYYGTITNAVGIYQKYGYTFDLISGGAYIQPSADVDALGTQYATDPTGALDALFAGFEAGVTTLIGQVNQFKTYADSLGVPLCVYEGGEDMTRALNDAATPMILAAVYDARMGDIYRSFMAQLPDMGPVNWYNDVGTYNKYGTWGHKEWTDQPASASPKWTAITGAAPPVTPDFLLAVTGSGSLVQGGTATRTITVTNLNAYAGTVTLSVLSGLPAGVTASFAPPTLAGGTSTLTLTASGSAAAGTTTLVVRATDGTLTHTASSSLTVTGGVVTPPPATPRARGRLLPGRRRRP